MTRIEPMDRIVVDGENGVCFVRPGDEFQRAFAESMALREERQAAYARERDLPTVTLDGADIELHINAGLLIDVPHLDTTGAAGIGLYRTEVPFMVRTAHPDVAAQQRLYANVLDQAGGRPVVFRTLDIGGDKIPSYAPESHEENPAMGWRAIRIGLDRPYMLRQQLRALLAAGAGRSLNIMFPMVADVAELNAARAILDLELQRLEDTGAVMPAGVRVGTMLEVPSLVFQLPALLPRIDFLSIGSNDLLQFLFASDRGNPKLDGRYDALSPSMLGLLNTVVRGCADRGVPVSLCGEMAGSALDAMVLVGLGFRQLSMNAQSVGPVRAMIRSMNAGKVASLVENTLNSSEHSLRVFFSSYAKDHGIQI